MNTALSCLRYSYESHKSGSYHLTNGTDCKWGHTWISVLGIERMVFALDALKPYLTEEDEKSIRHMFLSEADWILREYPVKAGLINDNRPESNLWNGAFLMRCAIYYPDAPYKNEYMEKAEVFIRNSISTPSDSADELFVGANFFDSFACNHHRYMNVGYMVITLSQLAYLHFTCKSRGIKLPEYVYRNVPELWALVRECIFPDGRLIRIGGDTRIRYCYCQDYLNIVLYMISDLYDEDVSALELGWQKTVQHEQRENNDGTFLSTRLELFRQRAPLYFMRLESDRAVSAAQGAYVHRLWPSLGKKKHRYSDFSWHDDYHGACYVRNDRKIASFVWVAAQKPQGLCLPLNDSSMAEWDKNLVSIFEGDGLFNEHIVTEHHEEMLESGFVTTGKTRARTWEMLDESKNEEINIELSLLFASLPDGDTCVTLQFAKALRHCHLLKVHGLHLQIANDMFNGYTRSYVCDGKTATVDGVLSVTSIYGDELKIVKGDHRTIGLSNKYCYDRGMLKVDEICTTVYDGPKWFEKDECILDFGAAITVSGNPVSCSLISSEGNRRTVSVTGTDGVDYIIEFNMDTMEGSVKTI
ncbi:MAG: hypothetical protein GX633_06845 [Clostridiales bacterium]|nr:hypothetical protein [Clostridiales bacterium]